MEKVQRTSTPLTEVGRDLGDLRCCNRCGSWLERTTDNYFRDSDAPLGWSRACKPCDRARQNERNAKIRSGELLPKPNARGLRAAASNGLPKSTKPRARRGT